MPPPVTDVAIEIRKLRIVIFAAMLLDCKVDSALLQLLIDRATIIADTLQP